MKRSISFRPYARDFVRPLRTARGEWAVREGFIIRIEREEGLVGYGEVAPLPEFGTETVHAAGQFLSYLVSHPEAKVPDALPCCAFGLSAAAGLSSPEAASEAAEIAALLPAGTLALEVAPVKRAEGFRTFKWKIGVEPVEEETEICAGLLDRLGPEAALRLDANGGLKLSELHAWLDFLQPHRKQIEFLEQPLPAGKEATMAELASASGVQIALDESLNGALGRRWLEPGAWAGPLVVKPLLMGDCSPLAARLRPHAPKLVFSSVFETDVGMVNALTLRQLLSDSPYALGFDTRSAFRDGLAEQFEGSRVCVTRSSALNLEQIWNRLPTRLN